MRLPTSPPYMAQSLLPLLTQAQRTRLETIPGGTHQLFLERNRDLPFAAVRRWLFEG